MQNTSAWEPTRTEQVGTPYPFPTVRADHKHARALLENAMRYIAPGSGTIDVSTGYPVEGWNHDSNKGLCLRSFTQLTAIGEWIEILADSAAGYADNPYLSKEQAIERLKLVLRTLRHDQKDPQVSAKGLLGNFLGLEPGKRLGPLVSDVSKQAFLSAFGPEKGEAIWIALKTKGWLVPTSNGKGAVVHRSAKYGSSFFDEALAPFADDATKTKVMGLLDQRVVMVIFGDNANLSTSVAKALGALLHPSLANNPRVGELRRDMERFLEDQQEGYAFLYDAQAGLFRFGWDATRNRMVGWEDGEGNWQAGRMDYLVNEFRGPTKFVVLRYGIPMDAVRNLGFKIKPYRMRNGNEVYTLAPWEGSAFQALGLSVSMTELSHSSWRSILEDVVDIEIDYASRKRLPGFLSESYTGEGGQYTGNVGIPDIAVTTAPRITDVASLYTIGVAYSVSPEKVEQFLADNWALISTLLTDHGPWEGFNLAKHEPIQVQTSAHTMSLILGLLGTGSDNMKKYLESKGLDAGLMEMYRPGEPVDLFSEATKVFAWTDKGSVIETARQREAFQVKSARIDRFGIAFVPPRPEGVNLSGGRMSIRYRSTQPMEQATITFKPADNSPAAASWISKELFTRFANTNGREEEIQLPLPAIPGLTRVKEVVISYGHDKGHPLDLAITRFAFTPVLP